MSLKDKIEALIIGLGLTSTRFADYIGVNRPIISHILSGRNKASLEIIQKIVTKFPELGYNWISDDEDLDTEIVAQIVKNKDFNALFSSFYSSRELHDAKNPDLDADLLNSQAIKNGTKTIQKIVVFYSDNTFSTFDPSGM